MSEGFCCHAVEGGVVVWVVGFVFELGHVFEEGVEVLLVCVGVGVEFAQPVFGEECP